MDICKHTEIPPRSSSMPYAKTNVRVGLNPARSSSSTTVLPKCQLECEYGDLAKMTYRLPIRPGLSSQLPRPHIYSPTCWSEQIFASISDNRTVKISRERSMMPLVHCRRLNWHDI